MSAPLDRPAPPAGPPGSAQLIIRAGDELYAIAGAAVREVTRWRAPTPVPGAPPVLPGIISQRGLVLPVVDLRLLLEMPAGPPDRATRLVIVQHDPFELALLVDAVADLAELAPDSLSPPPAGLDPRRARLLAAVARHGDQPLAVLDLPALIAAAQEAVS